MLQNGFEGARSGGTCIKFVQGTEQETSFLQIGAVNDGAGQYI